MAIIDLTHIPGEYEGSARAVADLFNAWGNYSSRVRDAKRQESFLKKAAEGKTAENIIREIYDEEAQNKPRGVGGALQSIGLAFAPPESAVSDFAMNSIARSVQPLSKYAISEHDARLKRMDIENKALEQKMSPENMAYEYHRDSVRAKQDQIRNVLYAGLPDDQASAEVQRLNKEVADHLSAMGQLRIGTPQPGQTSGANEAMESLGMTKTKLREDADAIGTPELPAGMAVAGELRNIAKGINPTVPPQAAQIPAQKPINVVASNSAPPYNPPAGAVTPVSTGPATVEEFEAEVQRIGQTDQNAAREYYQRFASKF